ncbi:MAG: sulfatase, partial [Bacteroidales bacterium]
NLETRGKPMSSECVEVHDTAYVDGKIADKAIQLLSSFSEDGTDFFLAVGHLKPHLPFNAPKKYWDMYEREDFKLEQYRERPAGAPQIAFHKWQELRGYKDVPGQGPISPEKEMELRHAYYACVSYIDAQIGKVLDALDMLGLRKNTIIVFWGDHGYHLGEQDLWCKSTNFELSAHSPLIISAPGTSKAGVKCNAIVESLDIYPTLSDLCGISSEWIPSGSSLKPLLEDPEGGWESIAFNQFARPYEAAIGARVPVSHMGYSVRTDEWRYTAWFNVATGEFEFPELYPAAASIAPPENLAGNPQFRDVEATHLKLVSDFRKRYNQ